MDPAARPYRSVLYIPGSKPRALEKARTLAVDAIIFDLEDAVAVEEKPAARALLVQTLRMPTMAAAPESCGSTASIPPGGVTTWRRWRGWRSRRS